MQKKEYSIEIGGKPLTAQFTDLADQAHGSVILRYGNTAVLATAVMSDTVKDGLSYFPLTVDYEEKFYAAGAILGNRFMRREGRPSDEAILSGRAVDRTIRPLFNQKMRNEVQVVITILSLDEYDPDVLAVNAASLALLTSDIPWGGPVSCVRIGKKREGDEFLINPEYKDRVDAETDLDSIMCGKDGKINMIEVGAKEVHETLLSNAFKKAREEIERLQEFQLKIAQEIGKEKRVIHVKTAPESMVGLFAEHIEGKLLDSVFCGVAGKSNIMVLKNEWLALFKEKIPNADPSFASDYYEEKVDELIHRQAIENNKRADGRGLDEVRALYAQAGGVSPVLHGSGIFYRGGTHVFSALTLGGPGDSLLIDSMEEQNAHKRFIHHYNFPPFSSGETGRLGGLNRRMIGHGALAEKALEAVIPTKENFPYTIRLVSESMASNGSTSMASVCAGTLALLDGGVPITALVAGIAMGLMMKDERTYKILTDIQGPEDHHGDMDFKVAGTHAGVTAIQMDVKVDGIPIAILEEALVDAKKAREHILDILNNEISKPRSDISPRAPKIVTLSVKQDQIGMVIGPGGKMINGIKDKTGVEDITIEEDGTVFITGKNGTAEEAARIINEMTREYKAGEQFEGEVTRILDFGAFVKIGSNTEGLVHISEVAPFRIENISEVLTVGEKVPVVIKEIDEKNRINLSIKSIDPDFVQRNKGNHPHTE
ncbi:MAG TPA: polyribonucleotide nucleotidyltransferase [Candidatus Paceibacterota bacterium]